MRFTYCPHCGNEAIKKEIGDEGLIPYCTCCEIPLWEDSIGWQLVKTVIEKSG